MAEKIDELYLQWKNAENEYKQLGQECHQLIKALDSAKARKKELEPISRSEWDAYHKQQYEIGKNIKYYENIGDEAAAKMRSTLSESQQAYSWSEGARAKDLSLIGHEYEKQARDANAEKDIWIQQSKSLKISIENSPVQTELQAVKAQIDKLYTEFNTINAKREVAKKMAIKLKTELREAKKQV